MDGKPGKDGLILNTSHEIFQGFRCAPKKSKHLSIQEGVMFEQISTNPEICHGQACVKGTRIPVHQVVRMLAGGDTIDDLLREYPVLLPALTSSIPACLRASMPWLIAQSRVFGNDCILVPGSHRRILGSGQRF
jgi:uncharacterized protein (DUF433 family)